MVREIADRSYEKAKQTYKSAKKDSKSLHDSGTGIRVDELEKQEQQEQIFLAYIESKEDFENADIAYGVAVGQYKEAERMAGVAEAVIVGSE